ncbi:hypothetical protein BH10CYA1_BH10CYA1_37250 [soil metagenome]
MFKVRTLAAIALVAFAPMVTIKAQAQGNNDVPAASTGSGTQLAMAVPTCDPANLRVVAQKNYQCSQFRIAQQLYKQVCQMPGVTANDYYWLGESYMHASMFNEAAGAFQEGVKLSPTSDSLHVSLVNSLIASHQIGQAHDACLKAASSVSDPRARKQLEVLLKIASMPLPPAMQRESRGTNHVER